MYVCQTFDVKKNKYILNNLWPEGHAQARAFYLVTFSLCHQIPWCAQAAVPLWTISSPIYSGA